MKSILVISKGLVHPDVLCRLKLRASLRKIRTDATFEFSSSLKSLDGIDGSSHGTVVLFFHEKNISANQLDSLVKFVENGGNLVCIHGALASFKKFGKYTDLTGAVFTGHDKVRAFSVTGQTEFSIKDELYEFKIADGCDIRMKSGSVPVFWTRSRGKGRVYCFSPGHRMQTFNNEYYINSINDIITECMDDGEVS